MRLEDYLKNHLIHVYEYTHWDYMDELLMCNELTDEIYKDVVKLLLQLDWDGKESMKMGYIPAFMLGRSDSQPFLHVKNGPKGSNGTSFIVTPAILKVDSFLIRRGIFFWESGKGLIEFKYD